jgi:hypothetical protein
MPKTKPPPPKLRLLKFTMAECGPCASMKRRKLLERFTAKHPNVKVVEIDVDTGKGSAMGDAYDVGGVPYLYLELARGRKSCARIVSTIDGKAYTICRPEGLGELWSHMRLADLEAEYRELLAKWVRR